MVRIGIVGATGYAGAELVRIITGHPEVELKILTSRSYAGKRFADIYPAMRNVVELTCEKYDEDRMCDLTDVIFTALPHKLPMEIIPGLVRKGKKVIDLSADFRFQNGSKYEEHYQPHTAKDMLAKAVYGLSEINADKIKNAELVGNPGCYPTSVLLPLVPLLEKKLVDPELLIADSKSGISGAGRSPLLSTIFCEVSESFKAYKVAEHRHNPEMEETLSIAADLPVNITFTPHLVPMSRGMYTTIYTCPFNNADEEEIHNCLKKYYQDSKFVRLLPRGKVPDTLFVRGTNYCDIGVKFDSRSNRVILLSVIDNLVKGAAGQAVQNMNIMMGYDEAAGLLNVPFPL